MNKKITISVGGLITALVLIFVGYLIGRSTVEIPELVKTVEVRWEKGETLTDTLEVPVPYEVEVPVKEYIPVPTDTAALYAVWKDYHLTRKYDLDFSNDTIGTFKVKAILSENKLVTATSMITPNIKTVHERETVYKVPKLQIYALIGSSVDFKYNQIQAGVDYKNKFMLGGSVIRFNNDVGYTINTGIKF